MQWVLEGVLAGVLNGLLEAGYWRGNWKGELEKGTGRPGLLGSCKRRSKRVLQELLKNI